MKHDRRKVMKKKEHKPVYIEDIIGEAVQEWSNSMTARERNQVNSLADSLNATLCQSNPEMTIVIAALEAMLYRSYQLCSSQPAATAH